MNSYKLYIIKDDISDEIKQNIATEMNLVTICFVAKAWNKDSNIENKTFTLRWFTPTTELLLCGHATLAAARAVFDNLLQETDYSIRFHTKFKGIVEARTNSNRQTIALDFPSNDCKPIDLKTNPLIENIIRNILGKDLTLNQVKEIEICKEIKYLLVCLEDGDDLIFKVSPNFSQLLQIPNNSLVNLVIVTQRPKDQANINFNSRVFAPWLGVNEDPVCGSAHTVLAPFWKRQNEKSGLQSDKLVGKHCSKRGGIVICKVFGQRVQLSGQVKTVVKGILKV